MKEDADSLNKKYVSKSFILTGFRSVVQCLIF